MSNQENQLSKLCYQDEEEIDLLEFFKKLIGFSIKNRKLIISTFIFSTLIAGAIGIKIDKSRRYYKQDVTFNNLNTKSGLNLDGTKFDKKLLIEGENNLVVTPQIPNEIQLYLSNRLKGGIDEEYTPQKYSVSTKKGVATEEVAKSMSKTLYENVSLYKNVQLPLENIQLKKLSQEELTELQYIEREEIFKNSLDEIKEKIEWMKKSGFKFSTEEREHLDTLVENVESELFKYRLFLLKSSYVSNLADFQKIYGTKLLDLEEEITGDKIKINNLKTVIDTLKLENTQLALSTPVGTTTYGAIIEEFGSIALTIGKKENKLALYKNYYKGAKEATGENLKEIQTKESEILQNLDAIIDLINPQLAKYNDIKKEELVTIEPPVLVREKKWQLFLIGGAIFGLILGYVIGFIKEIINKVMPTIKDKNN